MARYRCNAVSFIGGSLQPVGAEVEYDGEPGSNLDPVDEAATAAKAAAQGKRALPKEGALKLTERSAQTEIPEGWQDLRPEQIINLARKLGAPVKGTNREFATTFIKDELARRATV